MKAYKKFLIWLTNTKIWHDILIKIVPKIRFSTYYTRFSGSKFIEGYKILAPGQFIVCLDEDKGTTLLVPGFATHAAFVVRNCAVSGYPYFEIAEMTGKDFTKSYFFDICKESSRVLICDCLDWDDDHKFRMIKNVPLFYTAKYDVGFTLDVSLLYCSELIFQLDRIATFNGFTPGKIDYKNTNILGKMKVDLSDFCGLNRPYISPDGLLFAKNTRVLWDSDGELDGMLGPDAELFCKLRGYIK